MTPGPFEIPFYQGATWNQTLEFTDEETGTPFDLTGLGPFVMTVKDKDGNVLSQVDGTGDYTDDGLVEFTIDHTVTASFQLGTVYVGVVDANVLPYLSGNPKVFRFSAPEETPP
jgi:hypothetical protein